MIELIFSRVFFLLNQIGQLGGLIGSETLVLNAPTNVVFTDKNAGNGKQVKAFAYSISDGANGGIAQNYSLLADSVETTASISKAPLSVNATNHVIIVNDVAYSGGNGVTYQGFVGGENESVLLVESITAAMITISAIPPIPKIILEFFNPLVFNFSNTISDKA